MNCIRILLIFILLSFIFLIFTCKNTKILEKFSSNIVLPDGKYVITNKQYGAGEYCLTSDTDSFPHLISQSDQTCGWRSIDDLIKNGNSVWQITNIQGNQYIISNGSDKYNKCLIFDDSGAGEYPLKFSWDYTSKNYCGLPSDNTKISGLLESTGQALWTITNIGDNQWTMSNTATNLLSNNTSNNTNNYATPQITASATSAPILSFDINSPSPSPISLNSLGTSICLAMLDDEYPKLYISSDNPNMTQLCGFNNTHDLVTNSRAVWNFYKVG